jgi:hypothetical protein
MKRSSWMKLPAPSTISTNREARSIHLELVARAVEVHVIHVEDGGDVVADIANGDCLSVKLKESHNLVV